MKVFIIKFLVPFLVASALFGWVIAYRKGWDAATYGGADHWGLYFEALGMTAVPTAIALLVAGLTKLFKRDASFLVTWLQVFLIAFAIFALSSLTVARHERSDARSILTTVLAQCPAIADFSSEAEAIEIDTAERSSGKAWRIIDSHDDGLSSLDCFLVPPSEIFGNLTHLEILEGWAAQEGLEQEGIFAVESPHPHSKMLSRKMVDGRDVMFEHRIFLFPNSFALAVTAAESSRFPTKRNCELIASLQVNEASE